MSFQKRSILTTMVPALVLALAVGAAGLVVAAESRGDALAAMSNLGDRMAWVPTDAGAGVALRVSGPRTDFSRQFDSGVAASFSLFDERGNARPDGAYTWELREQAAPVNDRVRDTANGRDTARHDGDRRVEFSGRVQWGSFTIINGALVDSSLEEIQERRPAKN